MTQPPPDPGDEPVCGESYDHDLRLIDEADGYATYECRECGAEVVSEPESDVRGNTSTTLVPPEEE